MSFAKGKVVMGEAPESESEDELNVSDGIAVSPSIAAGVKGKVVDGEAPESDEETIANSASLDSISSAVSASSITTSSEHKKKTRRKDMSLLSRKLCEANSSLAKNISEFVHQTVTNANGELNNVDHHILDCQMKVQEASDILRTLKVNMAKLENKLQAIATSNYIPNINVVNHL